MTDSMLPIIRQMHDAADDHARALLLLTVSDRILCQYREVFEQACRRARFDLGLQFIDIRRAEWSAVRGPDGQHKNPLFADVRQAFAEFAAAGTAR
jgi:hypothetical protein